MSETSSQKIDKYYLVLGVVLVLMSVLLVFSFKGVFSAFLTAGSFNPANVGAQTRVDQTILNEAYEWSFNKNPQELKGY